MFLRGAGLVCTMQKKMLPVVLRINIHRLTRNELAHRFGVSAQTINVWRRKKWITGVRIPGRLGYFYDSESVGESLRERGYAVTGDLEAPPSAITKAIPLRVFTNDDGGVTLEQDVGNGEVDYIRLTVEQLPIVVLWLQQAAKELEEEEEGVEQT
jgi:hypothetical protein